MSAPSLPAHPIDRFTDNVLAFLDNMSDRTTCECHIVAANNGFHFNPCDLPATICDIETGWEFCRDCYRKYQRGDWL